MNEQKKSKATGISISLIVIVVFLAFGFLIGLTQTKGAKNLGGDHNTGPYADFCFNEHGELLFYTGNEAEIIIPETYSISSVAQTKTIEDTNLNNLINVANRLNLENFNVAGKKTTTTNEYGATVTQTVYSLSFKGYSASEGTDITTTSISNYAFQNNTDIKKVTLPESLVNIGEYAFAGCTKLESINLPDNITHIGDWAFQNCDGLTEITLPLGLNRVGNGTFQDCSNLQTVNMQDGVMEIWSQGFYNCRKLENISFSNNLQSVENNAFYNCSSLKEINLPSSVHRLAHRSFYGAHNLTKVILNSNYIDGDSTIFTNNSNLKIYVTDEFYDNYLSNYPWNEYSGKIFRLSELDTVA